ncbi:MAG: SpoIIE family protein phosphatase [Candidatus Riflebacteria bacterium]|jgi:HAMP domain-containing protein|nr:SpoIIE family protein phosphatase [Candidatus Riflebacteria bacterium]
MSVDSRYKSASFGRLAIIFAGIMFLFLSLTASQTRTKLDREYDRHLLKDLETSLDPVIAQTSEEYYVHCQLSSLIEVARKNGIESAELPHAVTSTGIQLKNPLKAFFYRDNRLVRYFNADANDLTLFKDLMADLNATGNDYVLAQRRVHKQLLDTFGAGNRLELMKMAKAMQKRFKSRETDWFYYWNTWPDGLGVFFIATGFPSFIDRFKNLNHDPNFFGAGNPATGEFLAPHGLTEDQTAAARIKARLSGQNHIEANGYLWYFAEDENGAFVCRVSPQKSIDQQRPHWAENLYYLSLFLLTISLLLYLTAVLGLFPGLSACECLDSLSVRYRIIGLFFMASLFPVLFSLLIGATAMADRREVIENSILAESIAAIEPLEKLYTIRIAQSEALGRDLRQALLTEPPSEELFCRYLAKHSLHRLLARLEVRDGDGKTIFSTDDREIHGVAEAMDMLSRIALKLHAPARMSSTASRVTPAEIVSESVMSTDEIGMATIIRQRGRQWMFHMGTFPTTWYWDVYPEIATGPGFMCQTNQLLELYLAQIREATNNPRPESGSIQLATELNYHFSNFKIFPQIDGLPEDSLLQSAVASFRTNRMLFRQIMIGDQPFWATIKPEKNINTHVFLHLISQPARLKTLEPFRWRFITAGVLALAVSLFGALLVGRLIILPVGDLNSGIQAIRNRQQDFRIPVRRDDEFGALAGAFNKVIGELKELEYGRVVQESLLPKSPFIPPGYDIAFFNTSATDLAGDYHDSIMLSDGRLAVILGDVTGHGISAALAMAMAKATVNYAAADGKLFPAGLMDMLNALFNRELKPRHKFMTLVTVVIDPSTGKIEVDNAGQSYPRFYKAAEDVSEEIVLPTMPLGAMKKRKAKIETRTMQSGDAIILYSDGIIECSDHTGDMYGYDRFQKSFENLMRQRTAAGLALKTMMQQLDSFRVPGPYPDDVTLVIIRKL